MTTTAPARTIARVEDCEGDGRCNHCEREGLRWVVVLSDGSRLGVECARKLLGVKLTPSDYNWADGFTPIAEHIEGGAVFTLWSNGRRTNTTRNGLLTGIGGERAVWVNDGWLDNESDDGASK